MDHGIASKNDKMKLAKIIFLTIFILSSTLVYGECIDVAPIGDGWGLDGNKKCRLRRSKSQTSAPDELQFISHESIKIDATSVRIIANLSRPARVMLKFGETKSLGSSGPYKGFFFSTSYNQPLKNLKPNTKYYYKLIARDRSRKKSTESEIASFTTGRTSSTTTTNPSNLQAPSITSHQTGAKLKSKSVVFEWSVGDPRSSFALNIGSQDSASDIFDSGKLGTTNRVTVNNLPTNGSELFVTLWYGKPGETEWQSTKIKLMASGEKPSNQSKSYYGTGLAAWSLHNMKLNSNSIAGFKIYPSKTGDLLSLKTWFKHEIESHGGRPGYASGTGGHIRITLRTANSTNTAPSNNILATTHYRPNLQNIPKSKKHDHDISFATIKFPTPASLTAGERYFLVMENIDSNAAANFISINGLIMGTENDKDQAGFGLDNWNSREGTKAGNWTQRFYHVPVLQLNIDTTFDGKTDHLEGQGYFNSFSSKTGGFRQEVSNTKRLRQTMNPKKDLKLKSLKLYVSRAKGSGPLVVDIKNNDILLDTISIPASEIPLDSSCSSWYRCQVWLDIPLSKIINLKAGKSYSLELSANNSTAYTTWPLRDGTMYGFSPKLAFEDGYAQISNNGGNTWSGFPYWSSSNRKDTDLMFWFDLEK